MRHLETVMGIPSSLVVPGRDDQRAAEAARAAFDELHGADARFNLRDPGSEASRYARGDLFDPSPELRDVLAIADAVRRLSNGAFNIELPDAGLDTDGVVKGWAAQRAADALRSHGVTNFCLNVGGDVVTGGRPGPGRLWRVGVRSPDDPTHLTAVVELTDGAVATSGTYERGLHVRDGRTGLPAVGLRSATVVAHDLMTADVLATAVLAMGPDGIEWARGLGVEAVFGVANDGARLQGNLTKAHTFGPTTEPPTSLRGWGTVPDSVSATSAVDLVSRSSELPHG